VTDAAPPAPTLKCVIAWSNRRNLCDTIADVLHSVLPREQHQGLGEDAHLVFTPLSTESLRRSLAALLEEDEGLIVVEFETWSGYGKALDSGWLLARGH
jgi:hypothetical protein